MRITFSEIKDFPRDKKTMVKYQDSGLWFGEYQDGKLVGITNLNKNKIKSVYVLEEYRHKGIAKRLIEEAMSYCDNCTTLALDTSKNIFESCGFKVVKETKCKFGNVYYMKR